MVKRLGGVLVWCAVLVSERAGAQSATNVADWSGLNAALGTNLWADESLWDDEAEAVAGRLACAEESRTSVQSSYRDYPDDASRLFGARPWSIAVYADTGRVSEISVVFANKGDFSGDYGVAALTPSGMRREGEGLSRREKLKQAKKWREDFAKAWAEDARRVETALTERLGPPKREKVGSSRATKETVLRWDWNGHAVMLSSPDGEYVSLRLVPVAVADREGRAERVSDKVIRERLAGRVERRPNQDVVVRDVPMVDQGPKGFCVPATWERLLRYMGIPADMYVLAMAANTGQGGGTSVAQMTVAAQPLLARQGRRLEAAGSRPELRSLAECLDKGKPVMWCLAVSPELEKEMLARTAERKAMTDPAAWKKQLAAAAKGRPPLRRDPENAHMRLIIGYNPVSGEVAVSDSWGPAFAERWMTLEEAQALTLGPLQAVSW